MNITSEMAAQLGWDLTGALLYTIDANPPPFLWGPCQRPTWHWHLDPTTRYGIMIGSFSDAASPLDVTPTCEPDWHIVGGALLPDGRFFLALCIADAAAQSDCHTAALSACASAKGMPL